MTCCGVFPFFNLLKSHRTNDYHCLRKLSLTFDRWGDIHESIRPCLLIINEIARVIDVTEGFFFEFYINFKTRYRLRYGMDPFLESCREGIIGDDFQKHIGMYVGDVTVGLVNVSVFSLYICNKMIINDYFNDFLVRNDFSATFFYHFFQ